MSWKEKEWKIPRKGEVVKDIDGNLGIISKTQGVLDDRIMWVEDSKGTEIYSGEPSGQFEKVELDIASKFYIEKFEHMGFKPGVLCSYKGDKNIPLEILQLEWNFLRYKMTICLKDLREFNSQIMKTEDYSLLEIFDENYPPIENIVSPSPNGLGWRIELSLIEKLTPSWENSGSIWEFLKKEDALNEIESWKSRLLVRRVASVINSDWKISFPCWVIEAVEENGKIFTRVKKIDAANGNPGYFQTALHAAFAMKIIDKKDLINCFFYSQDGPLF